MVKLEDDIVEFIKLFLHYLIFLHVI